MTCTGSMIVDSTMRNEALRPRHRIRESAYATGMHDTTTPTVASVEIVTVFRV